METNLRPHAEDVLARSRTRVVAWAAAAVLLSGLAVVGQDQQSSPARSSPATDSLAVAARPPGSGPVLPEGTAPAGPDLPPAPATAPAAAPPMAPGVVPSHEAVTVPTSSATPTPTPTPTPIRAAPAANPEPRDPVPPTAATEQEHAPTPVTRRATAYGVTLTATLSDTSPRAGQPVTLQLRATSATEDCCRFGASYGEELHDQVEPQDRACDGRGGSSAGTTLTHGWNSPGRHVLEVRAGTVPCGFPGAEVVLEVVVDVRPGRSSTNGISLPVPVLDLSQYPSAADPGLIAIFAKASEADGYLRRLVLDWGDGSPPQDITRPMPPCFVTTGGTSSATLMTLVAPFPTHRFARPGTYVMTLSAFSTGCTGRDEQTASTTYTHTW